MFCDVNFNAPNENAAARVREVEEKEAPPVEELVDGCGVATFLDSRRSCKAFASAFSWVRTKLARF
jgi:hypothetical protein